MGISALIAGVVSAVSQAATYAGLVVELGAQQVGFGALAAEAGGAVTAGLEGAAIGAGVGGLEAVITGHNVLTGIEHGAEGGAITGGTVGAFGPLLGQVTGLGVKAGDTLAGAAGGALGSKVTGANPLTSALGGGVSGYLSGVGTGGGSTPGASPGGGASAAGSAAPASVGLSPTTSGLGADNIPLSSAAGPSAAGSVDMATSAGLPGSAGLAAPVASTLGSGSGANVGGNLSNTSGLGASANPVPIGPSGSPGAPATSSAIPGQITPAFGTGGTGGVSSVPAATGGLSMATPQATTGGGIGGWIKSNPSEALTLGLFGAEALRGNQLPPGFDQLKTQANSQITQGSQLESYLKSGTLPPGLQAGVNTASEAAKASVRAEYAARGMSGSSAEAQDMAAIGQRTEAQAAQIALQLFQQGFNEQQIGDQLMFQLMQVQMQQDQALGSSIGNFAAALAGMGRAPVPAGG